MKERLIELLKNVSRNTRACYDQFADYLLANGVIVPPYKVGDTVYVIADNLHWKAKVLSVWYRRSKYKEEYFVAVKYRDGEIKSYYGSEIYFTKEEAEQALRKEDEGK